MIQLMTFTANWWTREDGPEDANLHAIARVLSLSSRVTSNWEMSLITGKRQTSFTHLSKMSEEEDTSLTSVPGKVVV